MTQDVFFPIGTPGQPWNEHEKAQWLEQVTIKRSYHDEVVSQFSDLTDIFEMVNYGALDFDPVKYPLFAFKSKNWDDNKKTILVTGGVHGYETSGVHGAIQFLKTKASFYHSFFNIRSNVYSFIANNSIQLN